MAQLEVGLFDKNLNSHCQETNEDDSERETVQSTLVASLDTDKSCAESDFDFVSRCPLQKSQVFLDRLFDSIDQIPYGIRWFFKHLRSLVMVCYYCFCSFVSVNVQHQKI